jgi:hypothetical protein
MQRQLVLQFFVFRIQCAACTLTVQIWAVEKCRKGCVAMLVWSIEWCCIMMVWIAVLVEQVRSAGCGDS